MLLKFYGFVLILLVLATSCSDKKTPGGVTYKVIRKGDGVVPELGKYLVLNMELLDNKDSLWFSSKKQPAPVVLPVQDASMDNDPGEYGVFKQLTKGDSVTFKLDVNTIFIKTRRQRIPKNLDPKTLFTFNVGLKDVWTEQQMQEAQAGYQAAMMKKSIENDSIIISKFLTEQNIQTISSPTGLRYVVKKEGKGDLIKSGQTAYVHYAGYFLNGKAFDTSLSKVAKENNLGARQDKPYPVVVNTGGVIKGWDVMLQLMKKGMSVRVYIPSALGYGPQGNGPGIPGDAILVFDMEVVDVK